MILDLTINSNQYVGNYQHIDFSDNRFSNMTTNNVRFIKKNLINIMKNTLVISLLLFFSVVARAQENWITASGGYAFVNLEDSDEKLNGWRINLSYEKNAFEGKMANGVTLGYIATEGSFGSGLTQRDYKLNTWPLYYVPKYLIGSGSIKGFIKGAIGLHFSNYTKTETLIIKEDKGVGFYGGLGAGAMLDINMIFISLEYEWAYASSTFYIDGFMNSANFGIGVKF